MKALISPNEKILDGVRVAQVAEDSFEIALPLFWTDCPDYVIADLYYYNSNSLNNFIKIEPSAEDIEKNYVSITQNYLDSTAKNYGYDSILSAVSYAEDTFNQTYQLEGKAFLNWRSNVWTTAYPVIDKIKNKEIETPNTVTYISMLPRFEL
jgi:hypothetical protein